MREAPRGGTIPGQETTTRKAQKSGALKCPTRTSEDTCFLDRRTRGVHTCLLCLLDTATKVLSHISSIRQLSLRPPSGTTGPQTALFSSAGRAGGKKTNSTHCLLALHHVPLDTCAKNATTPCSIVSHQLIEKRRDMSKTPHVKNPSHVQTS